MPTTKEYIEIRRNSSGEPDTVVVTQVEEHEGKQIRVAYHFSGRTEGNYRLELDA
jgi:hypothetical protein